MYSYHHTRSVCPQDPGGGEVWRKESRKEEEAQEERTARGGG